MSIFEAGMLVCFGAAWPVSIHKSWTSGKTSGKSLVFLLIVFLGYVLGIIHKVLNNPDAVLYLYVLNAVMVGVDSVLFLRNKRNERRAS